MKKKIFFLNLFYTYIFLAVKWVYTATSMSLYRRMNSNKTLNSIKYEKKNLKWKKAELESDELQNWNIKTKPKERQEEFMEENEGKNNQEEVN